MIEVEEEIENLLRSKSLDDIKLGVSFLHAKHPEQFIRDNKENEGEKPLLMPYISQKWSVFLTNYTVEYNIYSVIYEYCKKMNYWKYE